MIKSKNKARRKDSNVYPPAWDYQRVKAIADYYDSRQGEDVLEGVEISRINAGLVWMEVPQELVPKVRKLIARNKKPA
jgi:hypothetical protein